MRRLAAIAAACMLAVGASSSSAALTGCFGAPADYVAAFDTVRGQGANGQVDYPDSRIFIDFQGWLTPADGVSVPGHHSEHIHSGACVPLNETIVSRNLDVRHIFHNVTDYKVTDIRGSIVDAAGSTPGIVYTAGQVSELSQAALASEDATVSRFQSYALKPAVSNGQKEMRFGLTIVRNTPAALVDVWFTDARWYFTQAQPGLPSVGFVTVNGPPFMRIRNWIRWTPPGQAQRENYFYAGFGESLLGSPTWGNWRASKMRTARPASWTVAFRSTDGATNGGLEVDPDHHRHPDFMGIWNWYMGAHKSDTNYPVTVPAGTFGAGIHRLFLFADANPASPNPLNKPLSRAAVVLPFRSP